jgi:hypothetical protein
MKTRGIIMLKIVFGDVENSIYHPPTYFDNRYEDEWMVNPLTIEMIKDIHKLSDESHALESISAKELSGE